MVPIVHVLRIYLVWIILRCNAAAAFGTTKELASHPKSKSHMYPSKNTCSCRRATINSITEDLNDADVLRLAQEYVASPTPDKLASDFIFRGPVIGPLGKKDFVATLNSVGSGEAGLANAFPDLQSNTFGFSVDPTEPNRVWYFERPRGTFLGAFDHPVVGRIEPTGAEYVGPPEARSVIVDEEGKIKYQSVGYVVDRFTGDTTDGAGAVFGMYSVMGEKLDDTVGSPTMVFLQWLSSVLPEGMVPKSFSRKEDLPSWWKDERMGSQK